MTPIEYLLKDEWTMGNGQCGECYGKGMRFLRQDMPEEIGHERTCGKAQAIKDLGGNPLIKGYMTIFNVTPEQRKMCLAHQEYFKELFQPCVDAMNKSIKALGENIEKAIYK